MPPTVLQISDLTLTLPTWAERRAAVQDLSLSVEQGELLCVVGESGSGKSMTALAAMRLLPKAIVPTRGKIIVGGVDILPIPEREMRKKRGRDIGMIFQEPSTCLNPLLRIITQIEEVFEAHGLLDKSSRLKKVYRLLEEVGLTDPERTALKYPHELSGGQRQRVMIAIALALEPKLLIADEPTTALDVTTQAQILSLINTLRKDKGTAVLFITHDFGVVAEIADRVHVMKAGNSVEHGSTDEVLRHPKSEYTKKLLAAVPSLAPPSAVDFDSSNATLIVNNLSKTHKTSQLFGPRHVTRAARNVSLSIANGETLGLVGESGSGKSTVGRCILRLEEPDGASIIVGGSEIGQLTQSALRRRRHDMQMVFQDPYASLNPAQTVGQNIAAGLIAVGLPRADAWSEAKNALHKVHLPASASGRYPHEFSGGQRQRICIARALAMKPKLLIADEPVSALDVSIQAEILRLLKDIQTDMGLAILFITHDIRVAAQICDRVAVMKNGEIVETAKIHDILRSPSHSYTQGLLNSVPGYSEMYPKHSETRPN